MNKTPRTDEHLRMKEENGHVAVVGREFARQLEIELAAAKANMQSLISYLEMVKTIAKKIETIEYWEEWTCGEPRLGTLRAFGDIKAISKMADQHIRHLTTAQCTSDIVTTTTKPVGLTGSTSNKREKL
jgi:hypothetical protein